MPIEKHVGEGTGIYCEVTETGHWSAGDGPDALKELLARAHELAKETFDLTLNLREVERQANEVLIGHGLRFPWSPDRTPLDSAALTEQVNAYQSAVRSGPPIVRDAHKILRQIQTIRQEIAGLDEVRRKDYMRGAMLGFRVGAWMEQMTVRPFEPLVNERKRLISWHGRTCDVTRREHTILSCTLGRSETPLKRVVKRVWAETYDRANRSKYDTAFNRLTHRLSMAGIEIYFSVRGENLIREQPPDP